MKDRLKCSICGKYHNDPFGHNALPINKGTCCKECNIQKVVPARLMKDIEEKQKKLMHKQLAELISMYDITSADALVNDEYAILKVAIVDDEEDCPHYDLDDLNEQFQSVLAKLEEYQQGITDGWNDKQLDYARDNMTNENLSLNESVNRDVVS